MIGRIVQAINDFLSVVPALLWALALLVVSALWWYAHLDLVSTEEAFEAKKTEYNLLVGAVDQQQKQASARLAELTAEVAGLQQNLNERHRAQEIKDGNAKAVIARMAEDLQRMSRAGGGGGLRDPNAPAGGGCGGGAAQGAAAAGAGGGAGDAPEAGGLLSVQLEGLLLRLHGEADAINRAYASCRADAMIVRGLAPLPVDESTPLEGKTP